MAAVPKIELAGVTKSFESNHVLKGINLTVAPQESLVIIGTSGCGKSVLMKCLNGSSSQTPAALKLAVGKFLVRGGARLKVYASNLE